MAAAAAASDDLKASQDDLVRAHREDIAAIQSAHRTEIEQMREKAEKQLEEKIDELRIKANEAKAAALKHANAKWQRVLQECTDESLAEKAVAMRKLEKLHKVKVAEMSEAHAKAIAETEFKGAEKAKVRVRQAEEAARRSTCIRKGAVGCRGPSSHARSRG